METQLEVYVTKTRTGDKARKNWNPWEYSAETNDYRIPVNTQTDPCQNLNQLGKQIVRLWGEVSRDYVLCSNPSGKRSYVSVFGRAKKEKFPQDVILTQGAQLSPDELGTLAVILKDEIMENCPTEEETQES
ncbi:MAG: hypothetical protein JSW08_01700 [archaeon]|nr:MAG: hypothetical protein JSW08_01700 [archaeon]